MIRIFSNPINGAPVSTSTTTWYTTNQVETSGITASGIRRGSGTGQSNADNRYNANGWESASLDANDYFEWTISPSSCKEIDFVSFVYASASHSSIVNFAFRSSLDGYNNNIGSPDSDGTTISLSANTFQNITTPITFRLYAWGANRDTRTFSINDFTFNGTVSNTTPIQFPVLANGDYVWAGAADGDWSTDENWSVYYSATNSFSTANNDPDASTLNVVIPPINTCNTAGIATIRNNTLDEDREVNNVNIMPSAFIILDKRLSVAGNWLNNGTFDPTNEEVRFNGSSTQTIGGNGVNSFYEVRIYENANQLDVLLNSNVSISNELLFMDASNRSRNLVLGNYDLNMFSGSDIGDINIRSTANNSTTYSYNTSVSTIGYIKTNGSGKLIRPINDENFVFFPIGNSTKNHCAINNTGTDDEFGIRVMDNVTTDGSAIGTTTAAAVVNKTWMINESVTGGSSADLQLFWNGISDEINGFDLGFAFVAHHNGINWENIGGDGIVTSPLYIQKNNVSNFSPFTIGATVGSPLPIELTSFQANCTDDNTISVTWSTASEHNTSHFVIEKSRDAQNWSVLGVAGAAVNSSELLNYEMIDFDKTDGVVYYRLTQYDNDGQFEVFNVVALNCEINSNNTLTSYPNPSENSFYVNLSTDEMQGNGQIIVTDGNGRVVYTKSVLLQNGNNVFLIEDIKAEPGIYYIKVSNETTTTYIVKHSLR